MVNATAATPSQDLEERLRLQDSIIGLLNDQLRDCRERLDGRIQDLRELYQRLQLANELSAVREKDLRDEMALMREEGSVHAAQQDQELEKLRGALGEEQREMEALRGVLGERQREMEALRRTWSWRLTRPLRLIALGGASGRR